MVSKSGPRFLIGLSVSVGLSAGAICAHRARPKKEGQFRKRSEKEMTAASLPTCMEAVKFHSPSSLLLMCVDVTTACRPAKETHLPETVVDLIAGAVGEAAQTLILYPLDTIKVLKIGASEGQACRGRPFMAMQAFQARLIQRAFLPLSR